MIIFINSAVAKNCVQAGLDAGCCPGTSCNVTQGTNGSETCYCDERCRVNGDCCEDVDQTKQCSQTCTLTISKNTPSCTLTLNYIMIIFL